MISLKAPKLFILSVFTVLAFTSKADNFLVLKHSGSGSITYIKGYPIICKNNKIWIAGTIDSIGNNFIIIDRKLVMIDSVSEVKVPRKGFGFRAGGSTIIAAGPFFMGIGLINGIGNHSSPLITTGLIKLSTGLVIGGIIMRRFAYRHFRIDKKKNELKIISL